MPIYEFQCKKCGHRFERMQRMSDAHPSACPHCKAKGAVEQLMSAPAAHFKGSGWYATDYAKKPASAPGKTDGDGSKSDVKAESVSEKKTEAKTESKTEKKTAAPEKKSEKK